MAGQLGHPIDVGAITLERLLIPLRGHMGKSQVRQ